MPFPFTFSLSVAGLSNPFSTAHRRSAQVVPTPPTPGTDHDSDSYRHGAGKHPPVQKKLPITRRRPSPVPSPVPLSRKRGWEPTFAEPSRSTATLASTSGYLDTPAKYREMAGSRNASADEFHEVEMFAGDTELPPPAKRRRGLAGSIVSTALSAALIGTAVGLTVYRLWRDRGKESPRLEAEHQHTQQPPPPPYQQGEWTPNSTVSTPPVQVTPATPRTRRIRHPVASASKRTHRRTNTNANNTTVVRTRNHGHHASPPPSATLFPPAQPEFEFAQEQQGGGVEDQMDWIGDKLSMLIEEGKRALGREIVVLSDAKEDEVDDGSGAWEEEENPTTVSRSRSRSGSGSGSIRRAKRPRSLAPSSTHGFYGHSPSGSPRSPRFFESGSGMSTSMSAPQMITPARPHTTHSRGGSAEVGLGFGSYTPSTSTSFREDERAWESPEIRESMERARMRAMFMGRR